MSSHNKWSKVKHKKALTDAKKSQIFGKLARLIAVESKKTAGDVTAPSLKTVIEKARSVNMPSDNIERAVKKGTSADAAATESVTYETYGPGGVAMMIEALTDNRNKTTQEVKHILSKNSCDLASMGSVAWAFQKQEDGWVSTTTIDLPEEAQEKLSSLIEALEDHEDVQAVYTNAEFPEETPDH